MRIPKTDVLISSKPEYVLSIAIDPENPKNSLIKPQKDIKMMLEIESGLLNLKNINWEYHNEFYTQLDEFSVPIDEKKQTGVVKWDFPNIKNNILDQNLYGENIYKSIVNIAHKIFRNEIKNAGELWQEAREVRVKASWVSLNEENFRIPRVVAELQPKHMVMNLETAIAGKYYHYLQQKLAKRNEKCILDCSFGFQRYVYKIYADIEKKI